MTKNAETPRRGVLLFVTPIAVLIAAFMYFFFATDVWTTPRVIGQIGFSTIAFGLLVATISPEKGWWGIRLVTFTIFLAYFSYLSNQLLFSGQEIDLTTRRSQATPFNAILGFLVFGIPCLIYTLWGSTWGRISDKASEETTRSDIFVFYVAWGAQILFLLLSLLVVIVGVIKWFMGS